MTGFRIRRMLRTLSCIIFFITLLAWPISYNPKTPLGDHYTPGRYPIKIYLAPGELRIKVRKTPSGPSMPGGDYGADPPFLPLPVLLLFAATLFALSYVPARMMLINGNCRNCGYSLTGNTSGICPECGTAIENST